METLRFSRYCFGVHRGSDPPVLQSTGAGFGRVFQERASVTANLFGTALASQTMLLPKTFHALTADAKTQAHFTAALPAFPPGDDSLPQILTQRSHNFPFMKGI
jgi:hypothetical protein